MSCPDVTIRIQRSTRRSCPNLQAGIDTKRTTLIRQLPEKSSYLTLLRVGFALSRFNEILFRTGDVTITAVGSYPAFSPLPRLIGEVFFLWHFPGLPVQPALRRAYLIIAGCYPALCSMKFGLSSPRLSRRAIARIGLFIYSFKNKAAHFLAAQLLSITFCRDYRSVCYQQSIKILMLSYHRTLNSNLANYINLMQ